MDEYLKETKGWKTQNFLGAHKLTHTFKKQKNETEITEYDKRDRKFKITVKKMA